MKKTLETYQLLYEQTDTHRLDEFFHFLKFKSISSESEHTQDLLQCANWLIEKLKGLEFQTELWETSGHPVIFACNMQAGKDKPTLLIYNHYDVQPVDPIELWETPPFEPTVRDGQVYARGAQDNKGQCFYVLEALKLLIKRDGTLPINIRLIIEGEEETGSAGLSQVIKEKKEHLQSDYLAIVDTSIRSADSPAITLGLRGIVTLEIEVTGSETDLHSGDHGGITYNPIHALVEMLSKLRDADGKITVPGFYDDIAPLSEKDLELIAFDFDEEEYKKTFGAKATGGEKGFSPLQRGWIRPTLEINGIHGGYTGQGFKTVIPAKAHAKISCRLVPDQDPQKIGDLVKDHLVSLAPKGMIADVKVNPGVGGAVRSDANAHVVKAFSQAFEEVFGKKTAYILMGGSIPIVNALSDAAGAQTVLTGLGLPSDNIHAPNEHFGIDRIKKGCLILARALDILGS